MSYENVDLYIVDTSPLKLPVEDVVVRVLSQDGKLSFTQTETNAAGHAGFLLPSGATYQLRFFKQHVSFTNPQYFEVLEGVANTFDVTATLVTPPIPQDCRLCTAYGHFRSIDGSPAAYVELQFIAKFDPLLLEDDAVLTERVTVRTDKNGYAAINLIRSGQYDVTVQGIDDYQRLIAVPDAPNVNLPSLLFPVVASITFDPPGPYTVEAGQEIVLTPTIYSSDGNVVDDSCAVIWSSLDGDILSVLPGGGKLTLRGVAAGAAGFNAVRQDQSIVRIPDLGIQGVPVVVSVT